jgi:hypothetical protein
MNSNLKRLINPKFMKSFAIMYLVGVTMMILFSPVILTTAHFYEQIGYGILLVLLPLGWFHTFFNKDYATTRLLKLTDTLHFVVLAYGILYTAFILAMNFLF